MPNKQEKTKILIVANGLGETSGGVASFFSNFYSAIDHTRFQFDFLTIAYQHFDIYRESIEKTGGKLFCLNVRDFDGTPFKIKYLRAFRRFLMDHEYALIHINTCGFFPNLFCVKQAKKYGKGAKVIAHSHCNYQHGIVKKFIIDRFKSLFEEYADYFLACSDPAGQYMFPQSVIRGSRYFILKNAFQVHLYAYDPTIRLKMREEFKIEDELVVGHVGRFSQAKNHGYLIEIFLEILTISPDAKLLLVGEGALRENYETLVRNNGIQDHVIFTGLRNDVYKILQAMDIFILPSFNEGLAIVVLEAQASGLPVLASLAVPEEALLSESSHRLDLKCAPKKWAELATALGENHVRVDQMKLVLEAGYDIQTEAEKLGRLYAGLVES